MASVLVLILSVIMLLAIGGIVCIYWTARGDAPRWARGVATATDVLSEIVLKASKSSNSRNSNNGDD